MVQIVIKEFVSSCSFAKINTIILTAYCNQRGTTTESPEGFIFQVNDW